MPYYCTVPRCTSMAGKAKDVSFHQFPKDKRLADIWNEILKRGKPYTKYSKVCSLHFTIADYTAGTVGRHKGNWRTLRKDAIPSQNLPSESPVPTRRGHCSRSNSSRPASTSATPVLEIEVGQHIAHAIYVQTMLAMQNAGDDARASSPSVHGDRTQIDTHENTMSDLEMPGDLEGSTDSGSKILEELLSKRQKRIKESIDDADGENNPSPVDDNRTNSNSYRCNDCSKCFKDPDVYLLHKRTHKTNAEAIDIMQENDKEKEKENFNVNKEKSEETLKANPILANLLKTNMKNMQGVRTVTVLKTVPRTTNGDRYTNNSDSDNSGADSDCDDSVEDSSENVIVKSEICIEEHDVMDQISAAKDEEYFENDENTNRSIEEVKNAFDNPTDQLCVVKKEVFFENHDDTNGSIEDIKNAFDNPTDQLVSVKQDPLGDDEAAGLNSEHSVVIPKSDIKVEHDSIKVEDDLITLEDLISS